MPHLLPLKSKSSLCSRAGDQEIANWTPPIDLLPPHEKETTLKGKGIKIYLANYVGDPGRPNKSAPLTGYGGSESTCVLDLSNWTRLSKSPSDDPVGIPAHEIGHILGLTHYENTKEGREQDEDEKKRREDSISHNLMFGGTLKRDPNLNRKGTKLTENQIKTAREKARVRGVKLNRK